MWNENFGKGLQGENSQDFNDFLSEKIVEIYGISGTHLHYRNYLITGNIIFSLMARKKQTRKLWNAMFNRDPF